MRDKLGQFIKGYAPWNKGKKGGTSWNKGKKADRKKYPNMGHFKKHSKKAKQKISEGKKGKRASPKTEFKKGQNARETNCNWRGGTSFEPYGLEFNQKLKEQIRRRDHYRCQECFRYQSELFTNTKAGIRPYKLHIHHIDYDKKNNNPNNLISLCKSCHQQTSFNREDWIKYFQAKII